MDFPDTVAPSIAVDIDDTLCSRLPKILRCMGLFWVCRPMAGAAEAVWELHRRHGVAYVTARNRYRAWETRSWLRRNGFPLQDVPLICRPSLFHRFRRFKSEAIGSLQALGAPLKIGIGDRATDAQAYHENGLQVILVTGALCGAIPVHRVRSWSEIPPMVQTLLADEKAVGNT